MSRRLAPLEWLAFAGLVAQLVFVVVITPASPLRHLVEPVYFATAASVVTTVALVGLRFAPVRRPRLEVHLLAWFLVGMPLIYLLTALRDGASGEVLSMEGVALLVFGVLAIVGVLGSPWFLAVGIAGHGMFWDAWHHAAHLVVPGWYAAGCFVVDLALGAWVATQVSVYGAGRSYRHRNVTEGR